jgi:hypothetical protein
MKADVRAKPGVVSIVFIDDDGREIMTLDGMSPEDARGFCRAVRQAANVAEKAGAGSFVLRPPPAFKA